MRISNARRLSMPPGARGFTPIVRFDFEPTDGVSILGCQIIRAPDGRMLVYGPPSKGGDAAIHMAPFVRGDIIELALSAVGIETHERAAA